MKRVLCLIVALLLLCEMGLCSVTSAEPENPVSAEETVEDKKVEEEPQADAPAKGEWTVPHPTDNRKKRPPVVE